MKKESGILLEQKYVFRNWTRKAYAVFNSLHHYVVIATLAFDVHNYLYKKILKHVDIQRELMLSLNSLSAVLLHCVLLESKVNQDCVRMISSERY